MSLAALCVVAIHIIFTGASHEADEGASAHLFQLLMAGQIPIIALFVIRWLRPADKRALMVFASQIMLGALACAPVWYLHL